MLIISLLFSGCVLALVLSLVRARHHAALAAPILIVLSIPGTCAFIMVGVHMFFIGVSLLGAVSVTGNPKVFRWTAILATVGAYGAGFYQAWEHHQSMNALRQTLPRESLEDRLTHEKDRPRENVTLFNPKFLSKLETDLEDITNNQGFFRARALERLHEGAVREFINSPGFGMGRGVPSLRIPLGWNPEDDPIPFSPSGPLPLSAEDYFRASTPLSVKERRDLEVSAPPDILEKLHFLGSLDFLNPLWFGKVHDRGRVLGFVPHFFSKMPEPGFEVKWKVRQVELVSLLKHKEPVVYVSDHLPRMKTLREAPVRDLTPFEAAGLKELEAGKDLHVDYAPEMIRMIGSLRAGKQCLECHYAERGELLGAFSYRLGK